MSITTANELSEQRNTHSDSHEAEHVQTPVVKQDQSEIDPRWQSLEMLPTVFLVRRRAKRVRFVWSCILFALFALFCGITAAFYIDGNKVINENTRLVNRAAPLVKIRTETAILKQQNLKIGNWSRLVMSARPDQSLLQALAAISSATAAGENEIDVKTLSVKLPLEVPATATAVPTWAAPQMQITADIVGQQTAEQWVDRLNASGRVSGVEMRLSNIGKWVDGMVQVYGEPSATRVLP